MSKTTRKRTNSSIGLDDHADKKRKLSQEIVVINKEINTLDDLIELGLSFDSKKKYNINLEKLNKIVPVLKKLKETIGMSGVKKSIVGQIIYFLQDFQDKNEDMLHTVIQGPPGVGKTMLGHIIGEIYWHLDIIQTPDKIITSSKKTTCSDYDDDTEYSDYSDDDEEYNPHLKKLIKSKNNKNEQQQLKFKIAKRSDLIAKYLGQTAPKTQKVIAEALGGVLFIDEAYSLGSPDGRDSYAKECIDTINQN
jgi:SpoVK/Ycf46/Vps4 family AAA+-type ATPase